MAAPLTTSRPELLVGKSDDQFRQLVHRLLAFSTRLEAVRSGFAQVLGLSAIQYTILVTVAHLAGQKGVGVKAIAKHLSLTGAFITIETGKLEKTKLITKKKNPDDKRSVLVRVTSKGNALLAELAPIQVKVNDALFATIGRDEFKRLNEMLPGMIIGADNGLALLSYLSAKTEHAQ
jgi:DNA-binding MarR family transcriptional regulator